MTDITIRIRRHTLSDKSQVFDVVMDRDGLHIVIPAVTERDAYHMQHQLAEIINERSVATVDIRGRD